MQRRAAAARVRRHSYSLDEEQPPPLLCVVAWGGAVRFDFRGARRRDGLEADAAPPVEALCACCVESEEMPACVEYSTGRCGARHRGRLFKAFGGAFVRSRRADVRHADDVPLRTSECFVCGGVIEHERHPMGMTPAAAFYAGPMRDVCRRCAYARGVLFCDVAEHRVFAVVDGLTCRYEHECFQRNTNPRWATSIRTTSASGSHIDEHRGASPARDLEWRRLLAVGDCAGVSAQSDRPHPRSIVTAPVHEEPAT